MYRISELGKRSGLARSTLLYYEKLGLIQGRRAGNGYRYYNDDDLQRLLMIQELHQGGLSLKECQQVLQQGIEPPLLQQRLEALEKEIEQKQHARDLLKALLGQSSEGLRAFHQRMESIAPNAHRDWLLTQGLDESGVSRLRWLSKDLHQHERYMQDFERIFAGLDRHGPGSEQDTLWALKQITPSPSHILDIGCGPGASALLLAQHTQADIVGLDNFPQSLVRLAERADQQGVSKRITPCNASMDAIPYPPASFDLLWSEGSAYIIGFEQALKQWRPLLTSGGYLVVSDAVWLDAPASDEIGAFWQSEYPDMQNIETRLAQCAEQGFKVVATRTLGKAAWEAYVQPLRQRLVQLAPEVSGSRAMTDLERELAILDQAGAQFSYQLMVLKRTD